MIKQPLSGKNEGLQRLAKKIKPLKKNELNKDGAESGINQKPFQKWEAISDTIENKLDKNMIFVKFARNLEC